jgi:hypothetical protein
VFFREGREEIIDSYKDGKSEWYRWNNWESKGNWTVVKQHQL